jgi:hypothetical protein
MPEKTLKRDIKAANLKRLENGARTLEDFQELTEMYDHLDDNRERRERYHEIRRSDYRMIYSETGRKDRRYSIGWDEWDSETEQKDKRSETDQKVKLTKIGKKKALRKYIYNEGAIIPVPICHPYWKELLRGDFINYIYDNADEMWQIVGDWQIGALIKDLTAKQKEALFCKAIRLCKTKDIARCTEKADRTVRKLIAAALEWVRSGLFKAIKERIEAGQPVTFGKRRFFEWYGLKTPDNKEDTPQNETEVINEAQ